MQIGEDPGHIKFYPCWTYHIHATEKKVGTFIKHQLQKEGNWKLTAANPNLPWIVDALHFSRPGGHTDWNLSIDGEGAERPDIRSYSLAAITIYNESPKYEILSKRVQRRE